MLLYLDKHPLITCRTYHFSDGLVEIVGRGRSIMQDTLEEVGTENNRNLVVTMDTGSDVRMQKVSGEVTNEVRCHIYLISCDGG